MVFTMETETSKKDIAFKIIPYYKNYPKSISNTIFSFQKFFKRLKISLTFDFRPEKLEHIIHQFLSKILFTRYYHFQ